MLSADGQMRTTTGLKTSDVMASLNSGMKPSMGPDPRALGAPAAQVVGGPMMNNSTNSVNTQGSGRPARTGGEKIEMLVS
jgi:hypothetical protein